MDSIALQKSVENLADSFERYYKKQNNYPRFKSKKNSVQSYTTKHTNGNIAIEVDVRLENFAILSDGTTFSNPKFFRTLEDKLAEFQRIMSRRTVGGSNWYKVKRKVDCIHEKMANARKDYLHKISTDLVKSHDMIGMEDLSVSNMLKNHNLAKAFSEVSWSEFKTMMEYKAKWLLEVK